jgi:hypothetical protein
VSTNATQQASENIAELQATWIEKLGIIPANRMVGGGWGRKASVKRGQLLDCYMMMIVMMTMIIVTHIYRNL